MQSLRELVIPEVELIALLSHPAASPQQRDRCSSLAKKVNSEHLLSLVEWHRVAPGVFSNLRQQRTPLFSDLELAQLETTYQGWIKHVHQQFRTYGELLTQFNQASIPVKPLKGIHLANRLYGDLAKRYAKDLDLLIQPRNVTQAHRLLTSKGYQCNEFDQLTHRQRTLFLRTHQDITYISPQGVVLELHFRLCPMTNALVRHCEALLFDHQCATLPPEEEFLYLCWHGALSEFHRLKWIVDIALYLEYQPDLCSSLLDRLIQLARSLDAWRALIIGWTATGTLYNLEIPEAILSGYRQDATCQALVKRILAALGDPTPIEKPFVAFTDSHYFTEWRLYQRYTHKLLWLTQRLHPSLKDLIALPDLPPQLRFLYLFLRPALVIHRRITWHRSVRQAAAHQESPR